jgi:hypothetical protein
VTTVLDIRGMDAGHGASGVLFAAAEGRLMRLLFAASFGGANFLKLPVGAGSYATRGLESCSANFELFGVVLAP